MLWVGRTETKVPPYCRSFVILTRDPCSLCGGTFSTNQLPPDSGALSGTVGVFEELRLKTPFTFVLNATSAKSGPDGHVNRDMSSSQRHAAVATGTSGTLRFTRHLLTQVVRSQVRDTNTCTVKARRSHNSPKRHIQGRFYRASGSAPVCLITVGGCAAEIT